jgi:hypothetical protein
MSTKKCILAIRPDWHSSGGLTLKVELWGRRSSQKFPESTSSQLAAPGSFDSVGRMRCDFAQDDREEMHSLRHSSTLALAIKRRRSSQKFPESTSLQLAAPGCFRLRCRMRSDSAQDDRGENAFALGGQIPRCARNEKGRRSSQKFPESTSLQLAAPDLSTPSVGCAPTPLKMAEGKCIHCAQLHPGARN